MAVGVNCKMRGQTTLLKF